MFKFLAGFLIGLILMGATFSTFIYNEIVAPLDNMLNECEAKGQECNLCATPKIKGE